MSGQRQRPVFSAHFRSLDSAFRGQFSRSRSASPLGRLLFTFALTAVFAAIVVVAVVTFAVMLLGFLVLKLIRSVQALFGSQPVEPQASAWTPDFPHLHGPEPISSTQQTGRRGRIIEIQATDSSDTGHNS